MLLAEVLQPLLSCTRRLQQNCDEELQQKTELQGVTSSRTQS